MTDAMSQAVNGPVLDVMAMNIIVGLAVLFAVVFFAAWAASPQIRRWLEKPGYRFQENAQSYDEGLKTRL